MPKKWKVEFTLTVADEWIEDGFELNEELIVNAMQCYILRHAYDEEKEISGLSILEIKDDRPVCKHCDTVCSVNAGNCYACGRVLI